MTTQDITDIERIERARLRVASAAESVDLAAHELGSTTSGEDVAQSLDKLCGLLTDLAAQLERHLDREAQLLNEELGL